MDNQLLVPTNLGAISNTEQGADETKKALLPKRVLAVIARCKNGQSLRKTFRFKESGETEILFCFEPSGKRCGPRSAQQAIESGLLTPLCDGLLGPETSQTWAAR
jgi:hypothetical protein